MKSLVIPMILASTLTANAEFIPGNVFVETCKSRAPDKHASCIGFIAGIVDSFLRSGQFCLPPNVDVNEISSFVIDYGIRNISIQRQPARDIVILALKARYPCTNGAGPNLPRVQLAPGPGSRIVQFNFGGLRFQGEIR